MKVENRIAATPGLASQVRLPALPVLLDPPPPPAAGARATASHQQDAFTPAPSELALARAAARTAFPHSGNRFIDGIARGAVAAHHKYGVPASVTIAQAILESGWGKSGLARSAHNLFGIKGRGPAGSVYMLTKEWNGHRYVTVRAAFRKYHNVAESLADHARLLATSHYYKNAMRHRHDPNAFANALTGVYATDPHYGRQLIGLMRQYHLYRFDKA